LPLDDALRPSLLFVGHVYRDPTTPNLSEWSPRGHRGF
jgi:hypothetical protein